MNTAAFEALYTAEYASLVRYATAIVHDRDEAESLVQEIFTRLYARWDEIDDGRPLAPWLQATLRWDCWRRLAQRKHEWSLEYSHEVMGHDYAGYADVEAEVERAEELAILAEQGLLRDVPFTRRVTWLPIKRYSPWTVAYHRMTAGFYQRWIDNCRAIRAQRKEQAA